jgi:hypothetical protein
MTPGMGSKIEEIGFNFLHRKDVSSSVKHPNWLLTQPSHLPTGTGDKADSA